MVPVQLGPDIGPAVVVGCSLAVVDCSQHVLGAFVGRVGLAFDSPSAACAAFQVIVVQDKQQVAFVQDIVGQVLVLVQID